MRALFLRAALVVFGAPALFAAVGAGEDSAAKFVAIGEMHEAIGKGQDQGRVDLAEILAKPHFYGVGALEGLEGEITIYDSSAVITGVKDEGGAKPVSAEAAARAKATMLVGQSVLDWTDTTMAGAVSHDDLDEAIARAAAEKGIDLSRPFVFVIEGDFEDVRVHVINGACPIRARMRKLELAADEGPYEMEADTVKGTVVGIYAKDAVGKLTHPDTSTHAHLIYKDATTGQRVTGHVEQIAVTKGAVLRLPVPAK